MICVDLERVNVHHALIGKKFAHGERVMFFETVPARLDHGFVDVRFSIFEGNMTDAFFVRKTGRRFEVIFQASVNQWQAPTEGIAEKRLTGTVRADNGPMLAAGEIEESVFENEAIPETEGGVGQREKWRHSRK